MFFIFEYLNNLSLELPIVLEEMEGKLNNWKNTHQIKYDYDHKLCQYLQLTCGLKKVLGSTHSQKEAYLLTLQNHFT